ncbi:tetratricopeptide repeat protein [archaeon BMS3Abin16]|nr:tetratricopeptide repeat protein [archaeon BMS3Abin16]
MVVKVFCEEEFTDHEHEWIQFKEIYKLIEAEYGEKDVPVYIIANFRTVRSQIDIAILLTKGIVVIDLKSYYGEIVGGQEREWIVKTGTDEKCLPKNLFKQLTDQKWDFFEILSRTPEISNRIPEDKLKKVQAWGYFEAGSSYDRNQIEKRNHVWFDVVDKDGLPEKLKHFSKPGYLLNEKDMQAIVSKLNLKPYEEIGNSENIKTEFRYFNQDIKETSKPLDETLQEFFASLEFTPELRSVITKAVYDVYEGRTDEAVPLIERAIEKSARTYGPSNKNTLTLMSYLATLYQKIDLLNESEKLFLELLEIRKNTLGGDAHEIPETLNEIAGLYIKKGDFQSAEKYAEEARELLEVHYGPEVFELTETLSILGKIYFFREKHDLAESSFKRALEIRENVLGSEGFLVSDSLVDLAEFYLHELEFTKAEELCKQALKIRIKDVVGPEHFSVAWTYDFLADIYLAQGKKEESKLSYEKALEIWTNTLGLHHPNTQIVLSKLSLFS